MMPLLLSFRRRFFLWLKPLPQRALIGAVKAYRVLLSPSLGTSCRFEPSCSAYALLALQRHGAAAGAYLTLRRLSRCQPWCDGGHDPVPQTPIHLIFTRLVESATAASSEKTRS